MRRRTSSLHNSGVVSVPSTHLEGDEDAVRSVVRVSNRGGRRRGAGKVDDLLHAQRRRGR